MSWRRALKTISKSCPCCLNPRSSESTLRESSSIGECHFTQTHEGPHNGNIDRHGPRTVENTKAWRRLPGLRIAVSHPPEGQSDPLARFAANLFLHPLNK